MKNLYKVTALFCDQDKCCELIIANTQEQAELIMSKMYDDFVIAHFWTEQITEVMGHNIIIEQG